jgi:phenylacetic acid degradation operon negative regulatory protein
MSQSRNALTARSVLLSVLLGTEPPRLPVQLLVRTTELFGIAEGTTRTALSRMASAGEVEADDGWYGLASERLLARQARQTASRQANVGPWRDGRWVQAVVAPEGRRPAADRSALRATLAGARLAELREGVWLRPDNLGDVRPQVGDEVRWFHAVPDGDPAALAARLWDLDAWVQRAAELRRAMAELVGSLEAGDRGALPDGFVLSAAVLRHFQADPLLPVELLPEDWPGDELRRDYDRYDAAYRSVLLDWLREHR